jgi:putative ABC transport system permease protein
MIKNYLLVSYRNLISKKAYSFINIAGLATGMAVALMIGLWLRDEVTFNHYHQNYAKIAKLRQNITLNGNIETWKTVPVPLPEELAKNYGHDFKYVVMSSHRMDHLLKYGEKTLVKKGVYLSQQAPDMFTLKMLKGSRTGLQDPSSIFLSASTAKAYFGDADPIERLMTIDGKQNVKVTGVYEDLPVSTTFGDLCFIAPFELYLSTEQWVANLKDSWTNSPIQAYVQLADHTNMDKVSGKISNIILSKAGKETVAGNPTVLLEPMSKWHLYTYQEGVNNSGTVRYVWMFGIIGVFVLLLACINFMNLSTARSEKRAKEVGIRKAIGSLRKQLITQFFFESIFVAVIAFGCSLLLAELLLPFFREVSGKSIHIPWNRPLFWIAGLAFSLLTGLIAGSYPALYLSSFNPVKVLKGTFRTGRFAAIPRKALVVVQFTVSVTLIICTIIVLRQVQFGKDRPTGYNRDNLVLVSMMATAIPSHFDAVKNELMNKGVIRAMARSEGPTTDTWATDRNFNWKGKDPNLAVAFPNTGVSADFGKTVGWQFVQGRDFSATLASDSFGFVLNEAAAKYMGLQNPIGEKIEWNNQPFTVIGVIRDMIVESPYEPVKPSIYCMARGHDNYAMIRLNSSADTHDAIATIESVFKKYSNAAPFDYKFIDDQYDRKFRTEERTGKLAGFFAILAIFISCLGLFGLASYLAEQRTREIGVRKVLGASVFTIWRLLSKEFVMPVIISLLIATPMAWYFMNSWLENYSYRAGIAWWIFAAAGFGAVFITLFTVSFQAIKAALVNPARSLKTE